MRACMRACVCVSLVISDFTHMKCDFEEPHLCGFQQSGSDDFDWVWYFKSVPDNATTGPNADHTTEEGLSLSTHIIHIRTHPPIHTHTRTHTHNVHERTYILLCNKTYPGFECRFEDDFSGTRKKKYHMSSVDF